MTALARQALELADMALRAGVREDEGANRGKWVRVYQRWAGYAEGLPWCCMFATYKVHQAARALGVKCRIPRTGSSSTLYRWFKREGLLLRSPVAGCVGLVKGGPTGHEHTFLVERVDGGTVHGIDGNWKNAVTRTVRRASACDFGPIV